MTESFVFLTRCEDYESENIRGALIRHFEKSEGLDRFAGQSILVKPNLIAPKPASCAAVTDPAVIYETAKLLKDCGAKPFVGDSPAWGSAVACIDKLELTEPLRKLGVGVFDLDRPKRYDIGRNRVSLSSRAVEADGIINLPKFKSHKQLNGTFAIKNMFGAVTGKRKPYWHFAKGGNPTRFCELLIEIYKFLGPAVTIVDAVVAMEGSGPINGRPKKLGYLISGSDPMSIERICCELIGGDPEDYPIIRTADKLKFGCSDLGRIKLEGDELVRCGDFKFVEQMPIKFSLWQVCRSFLKQVKFLLTAKENPAEKTEYPGKD